MDAFERLAGRRVAVRAGAAVALMSPLLYFSLTHMATGASKDELIIVLANGAISGALELIEYVLTSPVQGVIYCVIVWLVGVSPSGAGRWRPVSGLSRTQHHTPPRHSRGVQAAVRATVGCRCPLRTQPTCRSSQTTECRAHDRTEAPDASPESRHDRRAHSQGTGVAHSICA